MSGEANRSNQRDEQSDRSDHHAGRNESDEIGTEDEAEKRHDEARNKRPRTDSQAEDARLEVGQHASINLPTVGVHSPPSRDGDQLVRRLQHRLRYGMGKGDQRQDDPDHAKSYRCGKPSPRWDSYRALSQPREQHDETRSDRGEGENRKCNNHEEVCSTAI